MIDVAGWAVRDALVHHVGLTVDFASGNTPEALPGVDLVVLGNAFAALAASQVSARASHSVKEIVDEWGAAIPVTGAIMRGERPSVGTPRDPAISQAVMINDVVVHEGDVRLALGLPPTDETPALAVALGNYALMASPRPNMAGLGAIRLQYDGREKIVGTGVPVATLRGSRNDLVRTIASRRSREQILAMDWDDDPTAYVDVLPVYGPPTQLTPTRPERPSGHGAAGLRAPLAAGAAGMCRNTIGLPRLLAFVRQCRRHPSRGALVPRGM